MVTDDTSFNYFVELIHGLMLGIALHNGIELSQVLKIHKQNPRPVDFCWSEKGNNV